MTSTELTTVSNEDLNLLANKAGAKVSEINGSGGFLPQLKINMDDEDSSGNDIKKGLFYITEQEETVYAKSVFIRPLLHHYQWTQYDPSEKKTVNKTIFVSNFREEAIDIKGTVKCGKPASKTIRADKDLQEKYKNHNCFRTIHALVSYEGETADGKTVKVENVVALLRLKGSNFSPFDEEVLKTYPKNANIWDYGMEVTSERKKNGSVTFFVMHFKPDYTNRLAVTDDVFDTIKALYERLEAHNDGVRKLYEKALSGEDDKELEEALNSTFKEDVDTLEADFDEEVDS